MNHPEKYNQITKNALNAMINKKESEFVFKNGNHISRNLTKDSSIFAKDKKIPVIFVEFNNNMPNYIKPIRDNIPAVKITNVIFNAPATIVFWDDGTKTVVKAQNGEMFDPEKGLAMAIAKKTIGNNRSSYFDLFTKWIQDKN